MRHRKEKRYSRGKTSEGKTTKRLDLALASRFYLGEGVGSLERRFCLGEGVGSLERRFSFARLPEACFDSAFLRFDR